MAIARLDSRYTALLVVDIQERLCKAMHERQQFVRRASRLIDGFNALDLPILVTEQYRKGLGDTIDAIERRIARAVCRQEKLKFSACIEPIRAQLAAHQVRSVIVCGIEAHVCVLQTCLDLAEAGYITAVACDAITSRRPMDRDVAVERMTQAGVLPTTVESALLELVHEAGGDRFRCVLPVIK